MDLFFRAGQCRQDAKNQKTVGKTDCHRDGLTVQETSPSISMDSREHSAVKGFSEKQGDVVFAWQDKVAVRQHMNLGGLAFGT